MTNMSVYLRREEASQYLEQKWGVRRKPKTLAKDACLGGGPEFYKAGRDVLYTRAALDAYAMSIITGPLISTSEYTVSASAKPDGTVVAKNDTPSVAMNANSAAATEVI